MKNAAINKGIQTALQDPALILLNTYPEVGLLDYMVILFFIFWGTCILLSIETTPFTFPSTVYEGSNFSKFLTIIALYTFESGHPNNCELVFHCGVQLHLPND